MSINDEQRIVVSVKSYDAATGSLVVVDKTGFEYQLTAADLGPEFTVSVPRPLEILEAVVFGPGRIGRVSDPKTERLNFDSVGANPDGAAIAEELGRRLLGGQPQTFGTPDTGRFSHLNIDEN